MIELKSLVSTLDNYLDVSSIPDYCPNGLQVEGGAEIRKIITGVTASQRLLDIASERNADAVLVHHGYFWKGESSVIAGMKKRRLKTLLANSTFWSLIFSCSEAIGVLLTDTHTLSLR